MQKSKRLIRLIMIINAKKSFTVQELADEFGLSTRTVTRDLLELSELGIPIYSVQGRGGGYRLLQERMLPPISFTENEAISMFFAYQSLEHFGSMPFGKGAQTSLDKFYHYLPGDVKQKVDRLKHKITIWSPGRAMSQEVLETLFHAIMNKSAASIEYQSSKGVTARDIQPVGLYASSGFWYCPAFCYASGELRTFRADRILAAVLQPSIPYREELEQFKIKEQPVHEVSAQLLLRLELTAKGIWQMKPDPRIGPFIEERGDGSGSAEVRIIAEDVAFYTEHIWQYGAEVKIIAPEEAVLLVREKIKSVQKLYEEQPSS
ncbi:helix-turn-helix transcriptional regulator [Paenibacillus gansuensis]|uniref:Helix-turn-helix transcriptional regulator n=1 Tax=Paenibacillus gansuensis TaxID=306542 RepID=A0ABW5PI24_9BACL